MSNTQIHDSQAHTGLEVAIIGMAGRFPGAPDIDAFWKNLTGGVESITRFDAADLAAQGVPQEVIDAPDFVAAGAPVADSDRFDAEFFGYSPREAEILDPQHRLFLECAWHALEAAGYAGDKRGAVGVYASAGMNGYLLNLYANTDIRKNVSPYELFIANDKDFLATRASYKLDLKGPSLTVQTACSSSLVAVHLAVQALLAGECDMALAGGVALSRQQGYRALEGSILSSDGHCRAFDARSDGTVTGNGVGIVVLKRLEDALASGDHIDAVIRSTAINNDGGLKASFTAPQVDSQADVIKAALAAADVDADSIGYVEAHGTGTTLGDPIEIAALASAFRHQTDRNTYCALGSVKTNIGHLDTAAGIAGLIKTALMLRHRRLVPTLHFEQPNPQIDFAKSPFFVNTVSRDWPTGHSPRRAGVSSFGIGGTNAHVILEEAPTRLTEANGDAAVETLLPLSARSPASLAKLSQSLAAALVGPDTPALGDLATTLVEGRRHFRHRRFVVASNVTDAASSFGATADRSVATEDDLRPVLLFPGQGSQYPGMAHSLYARFPAFREAFDACCAQLDGLLGFDFRTWIFKDGSDIRQTRLAQPALFAIEYALGRLWMTLGVQPWALHGHSVGEYVAACLADVFDLETALRLVVERGRLMQAAPAGAMLAVMHGDRPIESWLNADLALAASNAPGLSVLAGPDHAICDLEQRLKADGTVGRRLQTSHAFHSPMMTDAAEAFAQILSSVTLRPPQLAMISNLTGTWLTDAQATDHDYWKRHLLGTVRFEEGTRTLLSQSRLLFIEAGPGGTLGQLIGHHDPDAVRIVAGLRQGDQELAAFLSGVGQVWQSGIDIDWQVLSQGSGRRVPLPGYAFERERYWVEPDRVTVPQPAHPSQTSQQRTGPNQWFYRPSWHRQAGTPLVQGRQRWLVLGDGNLGRAFAQAMERSGGDVYRVLTAPAFAEPDYRCFTLQAHEPNDHLMLIEALRERDAMPDQIVFMWPLEDTLASLGETAPARTLQNLIEALAAKPQPLRLTVVTNGAFDVTGTETLAPQHAIIRGLLDVACQEYAWLEGRLIDLDPSDKEPVAAIAARLESELKFTPEKLVAWRGRHRWVPDHLPQPVPETDRSRLLRPGGVFVVAGWLADGLGQAWIEGLSSLSGARIARLQQTGARRLEPVEDEDNLDCSIDCTDVSTFAAALRKVRDKWGRIDGVFLSMPMSNPSTSAPLPLLRNDYWDNNEATHIAPLKALAAAIDGLQVGFCCVQSSLSSVLGGIGLAAYAGVHHFIDGFTAARDRESVTPWFAINWDRLRNSEAAEGQVQRFREGHDDAALTIEEAWGCTRRILQQGLRGQTIISRTDLAFRQMRAMEREAADSTQTAPSAHRRPDLPTPFASPQTQTEATVTAILQELLGIDRIGIDDDFFALGGHSLMAVRAIAQLRSAFPVNVEMRELLFEHPTARGIAAAIDAKLPVEADLDDMTALLREIESLSDDEVTQHLQKGYAP
jgi:acyl transferase domain-containing protein